MQLQMKWKRNAAVDYTDIYSPMNSLPTDLHLNLYCTGIDIVPYSGLMLTHDVHRNPHSFIDWDIICGKYQMTNPATNNIRIIQNPYL